MIVAKPRPRYGFQTLENTLVLANTEWELVSIKMGDSHRSLDGALSTISRLAANLSKAKECMKGLETAKSSQVSGAINLPFQGAHEN
jgi:hypothetical protein